MIIKINFGADLFPPRSFIKVDYYKTQDSYNDPLNNQENVFNCSTEINKDMSIQDIAKIIEVSVNMMLQQ